MARQSYLIVAGNVLCLGSVQKSAVMICAVAFTAVAVAMYLLDDLFVSKVEQVECELRKLSQPELRRIREWLDDIIEDELEFTPEFEHAIRQAERDMADGKTARVREPDAL